MLDIFDTLAAIKYIDEHIKYDFTEDDFFAFTEQDYQKLSPQERNQNWYCLNPNKLNKTYINEEGLFIFSEDQKNSMFRALELINQYAIELHANATLQEKLFYAKRLLPPIFSEPTR